MIANPYGSLLHDPDLMQQVANYRAFRKGLRSLTLFSATNGLLYLVIGLSWLGSSPLLGLLPLVIGLLMLAESICTLICPSPVLFIVDAIAIGALGLLMLGIAVLMTFNHAEGPYQWLGALGVIDLMTALGRCKRYRRFAGIPLEKPSEEAYNTIDRIAREIGKVDPRAQPDLIQLTVLSPIRVWRGHLSGDYAVFIEPRSDEMLFTRRSEVEMQETSIAGADTRARFEVQGRTLSILLPTEHFRRFRQWKSSLGI
jgi:hypothetical protein